MNLLRRRRKLAEGVFRDARAESTPASMGGGHFLPSNEQNRTGRQSAVMTAHTAPLIAPDRVRATRRRRLPVQTRHTGAVYLFASAA